MPALVGRWLPHRIALGTGIYTNGLLVGEILPVAFFPLLFPLFGGSWRATFVFLGGADCRHRAAFLPLRRRERQSPKASAGPPLVARLAGARHSGAGRLIFASASALYYASNAFLSAHLMAAGRSDLVNPALTALNLGQLPASLLLIAFEPATRSGEAWPLVAGRRDLL